MVKFNLVREIRELKNQLSYSKRCGFFFGAGTSCALGVPNIAILTTSVEEALKEDFEQYFKNIKDDLESSYPDKSINIEDILNQLRQIRSITGEKDEKSYLGITGKSATEKIYWKTADQKLPTERGADYTQAIMDLGATLCTRSKPECTDCPVSDDCHAFNTGTVDQFPTKPTKTKVRKKQVHMLILSDSDGKVLLEKRPPTGIWGGLWSLPEAENEQALANLDILIEQ